jgi:hypothetical protein
MASRRAGITLGLCCQRIFTIHPLLPLICPLLLLIHPPGSPIVLLLGIQPIHRPRGLESGRTHLAGPHNHLSISISIYLLPCIQRCIHPLAKLPTLL